MDGLDVIFILRVHHLSFFLYFYILEELYLMVHIFIIQIMATAFMGYVLPLGQMSLWGLTVITNLLSPFPSFIEWLCGGDYVYNLTLKRFFVFHFLVPFLLCGFLLCHFLNLHFLSSNNQLSNYTKNKIVFFPFIISKDFYGNILILYLYLLQNHFGFSSFSHPDNAIEACGLLTPLHTVPEWYFLCQNAMLKAVPNKNAGFIILFISIFILFYFMRSLSFYFKIFSPIDWIVFICAFGFFFIFFYFDRWSISCRQPSILRSYLDITLLLSSYLYLMDSFYFSFSSFLFMVKDILNKNDDRALFFHLFAKL